MDMTLHADGINADAGTHAVLSISMDVPDTCVRPPKSLDIKEGVNKTELSATQLGAR